MITKTFPNGSFIDALASGEYACLFWNSHVEFGSFLVSGQNIPLSTVKDPAGNTVLNDPLFLRIKNNPSLTLAAQGHNTGNLLFWDGTWNSTSIHAGGKNPVIYDFDGTLFLPAPQTFVDGWSHINPDTGLPVPQIECYTGVEGLAEWLYLGEGIYVGQGLNGGTRVSIEGESSLRVLDENLPVFIRSDVRSDKFSLAYISQNGFSIAYWGSLSELKALPIEKPDNFGNATGQDPIGTTINDTVKYVFAVQDFARTKDHLTKQFSLGDDKYALVKFGFPNSYEIWSKDSFGVHHLEDASNSITSRFTDTRWIPKVMKVGYNFRFISGKHELIEMNRVGCIKVNQQDWFREMWIVSSWKKFDCGPDLGINKVIAVVYDPTNGVHTPGRNIEIFYFAENFGWIGWESHESEVVFATGLPLFTNASLWTKKLFYKNTIDNTIPNISGCAVEPSPIPPPSQLKHPQVTVVNWKPDATIDGWLFEGIDRENAGFGFKVWTENDSFYGSFTNPIGTGKTGATRLYKKCATAPIPPVEPPVSIPPGVISKVHVDNLLFKDESNNIWPYRGFSSFLLFKKFLDGENIVPYCKAWVALGYNLTRVFSQVNWTGSPGPGFIPSSYPNYNVQLVNFLNLLNQNGLYCELVAHTFAYDKQQMADHVVRLHNIIKNHKNVFLELANEPPVNGIDINDLLGRLDTSQFNYPWATGQYFPTAAPAGTYVTTHTPRDAEWPRKAKYLIEYHQGGAPEDPSDPQFLMPIVADEPIGGADFDQPGRRSNVPNDFYAYGALAQLMGAGATYHHESGLNSIMPDGVELDCAISFITGMRLVDVKYQQGDYCRAKDPNNPDDGGANSCPIKEDASLRTYGMKLGNIATCIRIRPTTPYVVDQNWKVTSEDSRKIVIIFEKV